MSERIRAAVAPVVILGFSMAVGGCHWLTSVPPEEARGVIYVYKIGNCSACRVMEPVIARLKEEGYPLRVIDCRKNPRKAGKARVHKVPTFVHYLDGEETRRIVGTASESELKSLYR